MSRWGCCAGIRALNCANVNVLAQLGDHDPSGVGAWEDFTSKVRRFAPDHAVEFNRLAVTSEQIDQWDLPLRPTKTTDSRAKNWVGGSVEVDAIPAPAIRTIVESWVRQFVNQHQLTVLEAAEEQERMILHSLLQHR